MPLSWEIVAPLLAKEEAAAADLVMSPYLQGRH